jgi:ribA/ribD-fused uncharacterized protein
MYYLGVEFNTLEHAYQAAKAETGEDIQFIKAAPTPAIAKKRGRLIKIQADWNSCKLGVMEELLMIKFSIPKFKERLLATGNAYLEETNWWGDTFWGVCNGVGENWLGELLMKVRTALKEAL